MDFRMNSQTPHFTYEEIVTIYKQTKHPDDHRLRETARAIFPNRDPIAYENLSINKGPWRAFMHHGQYENPQCVLLSYPVQVGVMKDGTTYPF
nr:MAG TPA: hypothetical protein [Caudoviricetes sp.]